MFAKNLKNRNMTDMYYDRALTSDFVKKLEAEGELRWLFNFVKDRSD
jgi:hypothetical protein